MNRSAIGLAPTSSWIQFGIAVAAVVGLYAPVVPSMVTEWAEQPSLSHGFAIPLIAAYLIWRRRDQIAGELFGSSPLGLPLAVLGLSMQVVGTLGGEPFLARLSLPITLLGTVLFLGGPGVTRHLWMGIAYLTFMVPLPFVILKPLTYQSQLFDATVTAQVLPWLGVPVLRDGIFLHLANMTLEVAPDCSSVPTIAALVALGGAYAQLAPRPTWVRVVLILLAAPLGLSANIVRIILTAWSAHYFGRIALDNVIHKFNGTTVFLITVVLLVVLDRLLLRVAARRMR